MPIRYHDHESSPDWVPGLQPFLDKDDPYQLDILRTKMAAIAAGDIKYSLLTEDPEYAAALLAKLEAQHGDM